MKPTLIIEASGLFEGEAPKLRKMIEGLLLGQPIKSVPERISWRLAEIPNDEIMSAWACRNPITPEMAHAIMGGLRISYLHSISGVALEGPFVKAEENVIRAIYNLYPEVIRHYNDIPFVKDLCESDAIPF